MREFIYFSSSARTSGNFSTDELMKAGRMDIVCHSIINALFISNNIREDTKIHLIFYGMPDPPKHLEIWGKAPISKKDIAGLIKRMLFKYKPGEKAEALKDCFIEKKNLFGLIGELKKQGKDIYLLDKKGGEIQNAEISKNPVFLLGDHEGLPQKELKRLKKITTPISLGKKTYFASQSVTIVNYVLDLKEI